MTEMRGSTFFSRMKVYGPAKIISSKDLLLSILIFGFLIGFKLIPEAGTALPAIRSISTSLTAIIIAGLAIVVSLTGNQYINFLKEAEIFDAIIFLFEWNFYLAIIVTITSLVAQFSQNRIVYLALIFSFTYMVLSVMNLMSLIAYYGQRKADFVEATSESQIESKDNHEDKNNSR